MIHAKVVSKLLLAKISPTLMAAIDGPIGDSPKRAILIHLNLFPIDRTLSPIECKKHRGKYIDIFGLSR
jgi:hypothetical protein